LAQILGLQVVAEGVEFTEQLNVLRDLGCEFGQGFLFAPALNATEATSFFDSAMSSEINA
jgi:EAL domain-containing protein (putative c-di-GMP-specific phosphodiesterase class I)